MTDIKEVLETVTESSRCGRAGELLLVPSTQHSGLQRRIETHWCLHSLLSYRRKYAHHLGRWPMSTTILEQIALVVGRALISARNPQRLIGCNLSTNFLNLVSLISNRIE